jgi:hypothetical protein
MVSRLHRDAPLWPAGHLPHKGGDLLGEPICLDQTRGKKRWQTLAAPQLGDNWAGSPPLVISPPVGEMAGRPEGGWHGTALTIGGATP